jgi:ABC-2 type transport system ATP-binding protein
VRILATLLKADAGTASVNGFDVATHPANARESISLTGQFAAVDDVLTGRENLRLIADLRHVANSPQTATDLLERFGLTEAADRRVQTYSGGMRRRLDIAMSLIGSPPVIFLDEPTTGLDPEARKDMWQTIKTLASGGTTIFLTTQYLDEADALADRVAILHGGVVVANDAPENLKKQLPGWKVKMVEQQPTLDDVFAHFTSSSSPSSQTPSPSSQRRLGSSSENKEDK